MDQIQTLEFDLNKARLRKQMLIKERVNLLKSQREWKEKIIQLEDSVKSQLTKDSFSKAF